MCKLEFERIDKKDFNGRQIGQNQFDEENTFKKQEKKKKKSEGCKQEIKL
jgi:hypothetical protein